MHMNSFGEKIRKMTYLKYFLILTKTVTADQQS